MNVVDSSAWLEFFSGTKSGKNFTAAIVDQDKLIVPSVVIYEVYKKFLIENGRQEAFEIIATMRRGQVVDLDTEIAILAADLSKEHDLPMADSIILAVAREYNATLWTQDSDFRGLDGVKYFPKK